MSGAKGSALGCIAALIFFTLPARALTLSGELGDIRYSIFAPDWIWQQGEINILIVLENRGPLGREVAVRLRLPEASQDFTYSGETGRSLRLRSGQLVRFALKGIEARGGRPLGSHEFSIRLSTGGRELSIAYRVRTIRGPLVSPGLWAIYLPVIIALSWCVLFILILPRYAVRGAWRTPRQAFSQGAGQDEAGAE